MSLSAFVFYCASVLLCISYLVIAALSFQPGGITGKVQQSKFQRDVGVGFFLAGAALYGDLAWHALAVRPIFAPGGDVAWDVAGLIAAKMLTVLVSLVSIQREKKRLRRRDIS